MLKSLFRVIRYSSVGIFLAGIFTTIVGCSNEDQLRALILFLLLMLSGGGGEVEEGPTVCAFPECLDPFVVETSISGTCNTTLDEDSTAPNTAFDHRRSVVAGGLSNAPFTLDIGGGVLTMSNNSAVDLCGPVVVDYFDPLSSGTTVDFSSINSIRYEVLQTTGSFLTSCLFVMSDGSVADFINLDLNTTGIKTIPLSKVNTSGIDITSIALLGCVLRANTSFTITPILFLP